MKDRITLLIKAKNLTAAQFADEIGVQKSSISHIISGRNNASLDFIQKILLSYPEVSMDWLMFGKGPIFKSVETDINGNNDGSLKAHPSHDLPPVDLFSELIPARSTNFLKENDLNTEQIQNEKSARSEVIENERISSDSEKQERIKETAGSYMQNATASSVHNNIATKTILKIVEFYSDNTYKEYFPG